MHLHQARGPARVLHTEAFAELEVGARRGGPGLHVVCLDNSCKQAQYDDKNDKDDNAHQAETDACPVAGTCCRLKRPWSNRSPLRYPIRARAHPRCDIVKRRGDNNMGQAETPTIGLITRLPPRDGVTTGVDEVAAAFSLGVSRFLRLRFCHKDKGEQHVVLIATSGSASSWFEESKHG